MRNKVGLVEAEQEMMDEAEEKGLHVDFYHFRVDPPGDLEVHYTAENMYSVRRYIGDPRIREGHAVVKVVTKAALRNRLGMDEYVAARKRGAEDAMLPMPIVVGLAYCSITDNFCRQKGRVVALARALKYIGSK